MTAMLPPDLSTAHRHTYQAIFAHPIARNLAWRDVHSLLRPVATFSAQPNGKLTATRHGRSIILHPERTNPMSSVEEIIAVRHFLLDSQGEPAAAVELGRFLVVIDHRHANIYTTTNPGSVPVVITPEDTGGNARHLHNVENIANGQRKPEIKRFYEAVIKVLAGARSILIFGSSTGGASAMVHLITDLKANHPMIAARIVGHKVLDQQHLTEDQLLAAAREYRASHVTQLAGDPAPAPPPTPPPRPPTTPTAPEPAPAVPIAR